MDEAKRRLNLLNPCHLLAVGFGSGLSPIVPGTMGTLAALPLWYFLVKLPFAAYCIMLVVSFIIGIYLCGKTAKDMGTHDHGSIVWDEFVGVWIALMALPALTWQWVLLGFVLFRLFDMVKPWPISWVDRRVHGGFGIMIDDVIAGAIAAVIIFALQHYGISLS